MALGSTSPRPCVVAKSGDADAAPAGAVDIALYGASQTGAQVALTGYTIGTVPKAAVAAADSANAAIAKLEKRIADLEAAAA